MKNWVETIDGRIVQVEIITDNIIQGRLVDESGPKLQYGEEVILNRDEVIFDDGTEDDLGVIFKNMDADVNDFFGKCEEIFSEERDFYGIGN